MTEVRCPECGEKIVVTPDQLALLSRFYCQFCDMLLEIVEEDPLTLESVDEEFDDSEDEESGDQWDAA